MLNGLTVEDDGAILFDPATAPRLRTLNAVFADLPSTAAEEMEDELPYGVAPKNAGGAAGPAYGQLWTDQSLS